jgi:hypothetical protein
MLAAVFLALSCMSGCTDASPTMAAPPPDLPALLATVECSVDLRAGGIVTCTDPAPPSEHNGPAMALLGQNQIKMRSANGVSDTAAQMFSMEATAQNLLSYAIGTPDGQVVTGLKVFFETGPTATAYYTPGDTGTVKARNPDGFQNFTAAQQPYHFYDTILQPQETTRPKRWEFHVPRTVARFGFTVRVFTATPRDREIPDIAPDTIPIRIFNGPNIAPGEGGSGVLRDVVVLKFVPGAISEERRSAIEFVNGRVIGGRRFGSNDGEYYVQITPSDASTRTLYSSLSALRRLPQVQYATAEVVEGYTHDYRIPNDPGTQGQRWQLNPDSAGGYNWSSEVGQLPFAWGCEVGSATTALAVVDDEFRITEDLRPNISATFGIDSSGPSAPGHGTAVASIAAARGNNGLGVTGVAWVSSLRLYSVEVNRHGAVVGRDSLGNPRIPLSNILDQIDKAARAGAWIINLSYGKAYRGAVPGSDPSHATSLAADAERLRAVVQALEDDGFAPLFVLSAGNAASDARWNLFPTLKDHFGDRVVVVGAADRTGDNQYTVHVTSNRGSLVDVLAPGDSVLTMRSNGALSTLSETSAAAPFVSGIAALLFSFDPSLTPAQVKRLIVQGAQHGNRTVPGDTARLVNAYESLKLAGQRRGAPLCGNRVWSDGRALIAQRSDGPETLFTLPTATHVIRRFDAMHGGKRVRLLTWEQGQYKSELTYRSGVWERSSPIRSDSALAPVEGSGGGFNSAVRIPGVNPPYLSMYTHGGDSVVQLRALYNPSGWAAGASLTLVHAGGVRMLDTIRLPFGAGNATATECWVRRMDTGGCVESLNFVATFRNASFSGALSPMGDSLFVAVRGNRGGGELDKWEPCPRAPEGDTIFDGVPDSVQQECRPLVSGSGTDSTWVYGVDLRSGRNRLVWSGSGAQNILGVTEDGKEYLTRQEQSASSERTLFYVFKPADKPYYERRTRWVPNSAFGECGLQYRAAQTGMVSHTPLASRPCSGFDMDAQGAPSIAPVTR